MERKGDAKTPKSIVPAIAVALAGLASSYSGAFVVGRLVEDPLKDLVADFDKRLDRATQKLQTPVVDHAMGLASAAGEPWVLYPVAGLASLFFALRRRGKDAITCMLATVGSAALNYLLKITVKRPRPVPI